MIRRVEGSVKAGSEPSLKSTEAVQIASVMIRMAAEVVTGPGPSCVIRRKHGHFRLR